ncbi:MAG TPA: ABC transporter permease [Candidatus Polarisedimenticolaceae bacterium]|nr:ABC transporter permease [Candidatus Polarisedimenticolaceae bacterium]
MIDNLLKLWAFIKRDFLSEVSYRLAFLMSVAGMFFSLLAFYFLTKMIDPATAGLDGIPPFDWLLIGLSFQFYFSTALYSFSARVRNEQLLGTLEAMLVTPTPTSMVVFSSAAWDFVYGGIRVLLYLLFATLVFGVKLHLQSPMSLIIGVLLTLLSSAGLGILSASFILYFKRGDPINFLLSGATTLLGSVFFPVQLLPGWVQPLSEYLPITWSLRIVRGSLLQGRTFGELQRELIVLALLTVVLLPGGLLCSRFAIRRAKREGTLIQY